MRCFEDQLQWFLLSILPRLLSLSKRFTPELQQDHYFLREGRGTRRALGTTLGTRAEAWGPRSDVRRPNNRRMDEHISNDGRSNRTPMFIAEIHVTHTQRGADAKKVRPGKDAAFRHR